MPYATQADLETRFGAAEILQLSDRDGAGGADPGVVEAALAAAAVEIDGYLAVRYALPLAAVPDLVREIACDLARYRLWKDQAPERVRQAQEDAVAQLKRLSAGVMRLTGAAGTEPAAGPVGGVLADVPDPVFDDAGLAGY